MEDQIFCNNSTRHFFKTVIFRILRIFNGLSIYYIKLVISWFVQKPSVQFLKNVSLIKFIFDMYVIKADKFRR